MKKLIDQSSIFEACGQCHVCDGSGYQAAPVLFAGPSDAELLVIGQNPGEMTDELLKTREAESTFKFKAKGLKAWYENVDFGTSRMYSQLAQIFGDNWLEKYMWTNAVRCRTKENETPSKEMVISCAVWTNMLIANVKTIVFVSRLAENQLIGGFGPLPVAELKQWKKWNVMYIPHPSSWRTKKPAAVKRMIAKSRSALMI